MLLCVSSVVWCGCSTFFLCISPFSEWKIYLWVILICFIYFLPKVIVLCFIQIFCSFVLWYFSFLRCLSHFPSHESDGKVILTVFCNFNSCIKSDWCDCIVTEKIAFEWSRYPSISLTSICSSVLQVDKSCWAKSGSRESVFTIQIPVQALLVTRGQVAFKKKGKKKPLKNQPSKPPNPDKTWQ